MNTLSQNISGDFMNRKDRHDNDFITFKVKYQNVYTHAYIPSVVKWALPESTFANLAWLQYQSGICGKNFHLFMLSFLQ